ncbi:ankyrin repeat domain-containing protein [Legionella saoudiensis]|uniref:ankyrin repeat domain-containing protein n=1 Tax=Legionella saoudiensis TaxID=1750561 RepID=UPI000730FB90|nr:ankyrin repeat domain-containing protein [Legionella saoudiensis]
MGESKSIDNLFNAINEYNESKNKAKKLKDIESKANKVIKKHNTLNLIYESLSFFAVNPLQAAIGSLEVFKLLIRLGANPFFDFTPEQGPPIDILANKYFASHSNIEERATFEWLMTAQDSPIFTWNKLAENSQFFQEFVTSNLIPKELQVNELPIHVAIQAGRIDLVKEVLKAAGSMQAAGDVNRMSILSSAIQAVFLGQENAMEILLYLLSEGASTHKSNGLKLLPIMQVLTSRVFLLSNGQEKLASTLVNLLLEHGATLEVTNPHNSHNPLMTAMSMGYNSLFNFFLDKADATTLNHRASSKPYYLLFQLFDEYENRLAGLEVLKLLPELKNKGLKFDKTIDYISPADPFNARASEEQIEVYASNMSVLHFYVDNLSHKRNEFFPSLDKHFKLIQALIVNGVNPNTKATFTFTKEERVEGDYERKKVKETLELTAAEYLRKIADKVIGYDTDAYLIKAYPEENEFLKQINYKSRDAQIELHKKFHQFRNLERVLSGEKPLVYSGLPDIRKIEQLALKQQASVEEHLPDMEPDRIEGSLLNARNLKSHEAWRELKKSLVDYVKSAESLQDFLERVDQFKKPLQLHFEVTTNAKGEVISSGSWVYRLFHYFDPYKFPSSWESVRAFGQKTYGIDINIQYKQPTLEF